MADRFSSEQVAELSRLLEGTKSARVASVNGALSPSSNGLKRKRSNDNITPAETGLDSLTRTLRGGEQHGFSTTDIASIEAAAAFLGLPVASRPQWNAALGRGLFCVFEGLDRSGKSTQSKRLAKHLESVGPVKWMCFPDRTTASGALIDLYLRSKIELSDEEVHLLFSANRWEASQSIAAELNRGVSIVCDRYAFSGVAYSSAKGLDLTWCQAPDLGLPVPDAVFYLHIDEKVGASRANFGDERYENASMQANVRQKFRTPELRAGVNWIDVDGARDIEVISAEIRNEVEAVRLEGQENKTARAIQRLWVAAE
jgi:dTMP kinase